ncbi:unnamed protein product [Choristocarpus tenellus]
MFHDYQQPPFLILCSTKVYTCVPRSRIHRWTEIRLAQRVSSVVQSKADSPDDANGLVVGNDSTRGSIPVSKVGNDTSKGIKPVSTGVNIPEVGVAGISTTAAEEYMVTREPSKGSSRSKGSDRPPESSAAEKVISLFSLGLVEKEEIPEYFEAIASFEKEKIASVTESPTSGTEVEKPSTPGSVPAWNLVDYWTFPVLCALLGGAATHSIHLSAELDAVASTAGIASGLILGGFLVTSDDKLGGVARNVSKPAASAFATAVVWASSIVRTSATSAISTAAEAAGDTFVKTPSRVVTTAVRSAGDGISDAGARAARIPSVLLQQLFKAIGDGLKGVVVNAATTVKDTAMAPVKGVEAAGQQVLELPSTVVASIRSSPEEAVKLARSALEMTKGKTTNLETAARAEGSNEASGPSIKSQVKKQVMPGTVSQVEKGGVRLSPAEAGNKDDFKGDEPVDPKELEEKMTSVRVALTRFDELKDRLRAKQTSGELLEAIRASRNLRVKTVTPEEQQLQDEPTLSPASPVSGTPTVGARVEEQAGDTDLRLSVTDAERRKNAANELLQKVMSKSSPGAPSPEVEGVRKEGPPL